MKTSTTTSKSNIRIITFILILLIVVSSFIASKLNAKDGLEYLENINEIKAPEIIARNAVVYDTNNKSFIYAKNAEEIVPLASLAKIMTAEVFLQINEKQKAKNTEIKEVKITKRNNGYNQGDRDLINNEKWRPENLIRYMLITSSNFAAESLVKSLIDDEFVFTILMNKTAKDFGFKYFTFNNSSGLPIVSNTPKTKVQKDGIIKIPGALGTAKETALLFDKIFTENQFIATSSIIQTARFVNLSGNKHNVENINYALSQIPNVLAGKTGTTDESGGNVIIIVEIKGNKYVIVVLGSTIEARYEDLMKLASTTEAFATSK